jgi:hypothetical protein
MTTGRPSIAAGAFQAYFIFDVADTIDLKRLADLAGTSAERAPLRMRPAPSTGNIQFAVPPLTIPLPELTARGLRGLARAKFFDFGVLSIRVSFPYAGGWEGFADLAASLRGDETLAAQADRIARDLSSAYARAFDEQHEALVEDYYICTVEEFSGRVEASALLRDFAPDLVGLVMAERHELGPQEQRESLRLHFSFYPDDLVVVLWDSAFVYEGPDDARVVEDILEFANSQLVEFRTYDALLDLQLDEIYSLDLPRRKPYPPLQRKAAEKRAEQLRYLLVDVRELTDRASNALKIIGDAYYARIYRAIAARLGLDDWQRQVDSKLSSVGELYRYLIDEAQTARSEFLELIVIVLIAIEIVVGIIGLRR